MQGELKEAFVLLGPHEEEFEGGEQITVESAFKELNRLGFEKTLPEVKALLGTLGKKSDCESVLFDHCLKHVQDKLKYTDDQASFQDSMGNALKVRTLV